MELYGKDRKIFSVFYAASVMVYLAEYWCDCIRLRAFANNVANSTRKEFGK